MKLLNELIDTLASEQPNLTDALMKTKVLLHKLGRKDLADWVNQELNGYSDSAPLPEYRLLSASIHGDAQNIAWRHSKMVLPTHHLDEKLRKQWTELDMRESISSVEKLAQARNGSLRRVLPPEAHPFFNEVLSAGAHITNAWCEISTNSMVNILTQVRSRLLDFLLDLQGKTDEGMTDEEVKKVAQSPETASSFTQTIYGNNNTILVGNHNAQTVVQVKVGDFGSLAKVLKDNGVSSSDIAALGKAVEGDADSPEVKAKRGFGGQVKKWMAGMMQKAIDTSWAIELGVAGNLLTDALKNYYGQ